MQQEPVLGIIGGLGPMATAHFLELTVESVELEQA